MRPAMMPPTMAAEEDPSPRAYGMRLRHRYLERNGGNTDRQKTSRTEGTPIMKTACYPASLNEVGARDLT